MKRIHFFSAALCALALAAAVLDTAQACSIFCDSTNGVVLAGRNWDMIDDGAPTVLWFVPATNGTHGRVCFGRHGDCEDGMNDQGLFVAIAATPPGGKFSSKQKPWECGAVLDELLTTCADVEQAIAWLKRTTNISINSRIDGRQNVFRNSGIGGHYLLADKNGQAAVCEWDKGRPNFIRKTARYQLITNFLLTKPDSGEAACPRFCAMEQVLKQSGDSSLETAKAALKAGSHTLTRYSQVYDLAKGEVHVFFNHNFEKDKSFALADELGKGAREVVLKDFFGVEPNYLVLPEIVREANISGEKILAKALEARGGSFAAENIHSYHASGTLIMDSGWLEPGEFETFAIRPDKFRYGGQVRPSFATNLFRFGGGFDGSRAWESAGESKPKKLKSSEAADKRADGEFFACYAELSHYRSARCRGEAVFNCKTCYVVELVGKSGRLETHYYDTNTFLLAGSYHTDKSAPPQPIGKATYDDYREFAGFKMPMRIGWQTDGTGGTVQYRSLEVNGVTVEALRCRK